MTVRIKKLKEPPLLRPPVEGEWLGIRRRDDEVMHYYLDNAREQRDADHLAEMLFYMNRPGLEPEVGVDDIKLMHGKLEESSPFLLAYYMRGLGLDAVAKDKQQVADWLEAERKAGMGWGVARFHYHLKMMGSPCKVTDEDKKMMLESLKESRRNNNGLATLGLHFHMKNIGLNEQGTLTPGDLDDIRTELEIDRKQDNSIMIGRVLHMLADLSITEGKSKNKQSIPPLRKFA